MRIVETIMAPALLQFFSQNNFAKTNGTIKCEE